MEQQLGAETPPTLPTSNEARADLAHSFSVSEDSKPPVAAVPSSLPPVVELPSEESKPLSNKPPLELGGNGGVTMAVAGSSENVDVTVKEGPLANANGERSSEAKTRKKGKEGKRRYRLKTLSMRSGGARKSEPQDKMADKSATSDMVRDFSCFKITHGGDPFVHQLC